MTITADLLHFRYIRDGHSWDSHSYIRNSRQLRFGQNQVTIIELTNNSLGLRFKDINQRPNIPYQEVEEHL
ncbi:hypothetical protein D0N36_02755 [Hymenobacter lapidiphilus]|uniref:hypothetical protein n=1 Tax=Hymenobacter sp. CCM 8763 TaxID=2303334 RepID=UPI000E34378A|nr:hypothetical protein [Hymenobacter sp. CCM 8763]RFP66639.1 hypothetical protein D0N36_02755 [Hymenobacter sp. CCM 8763]